MNNIQMNNKIQILPEIIINKIAAGEVVERPASVVKELVENSIDAMASEITVVIAGAGKELIKVIDNGSGMSEGDAVTAFERHATSKIVREEDLDNISTLGFRGEALASIAAVSRVELNTRRREDELGIRVRISGGRMDERSPFSMNPGTQISVKNLFYNVPARRAFLKSDQTEYFHIIRTVKRFLLSKPEINFKFYNGEKLIFDFTGESLEERIKNVLEIKGDEGFLPVDVSFSGLSLFGFIGRPETASRDRQQQYLFLNGRFIVSKNINYAVFRSYGDMVPENLFPPFILYLSVAPGLVDVNVHPTKLEVRFANEKVILNFIRQAVRKALGLGVVVPMMPDENRDGGLTPEKNIFKDFRAANQLTSGSKSYGGKNIFNSPRSANAGQLPLTYGYGKRSDAAELASVFNPGTAEKPEIKPIWQYRRSYIFSELRSGLIIIDQHRAHIRILYEQIINNRRPDKNVWPSQQLLFPQNIDLSMEDYLIYREISSYLTRLGFIFSELSGRTVVLEAIPTELKSGNETDMVLKIIHTLKEEKIPSDMMFDRFAMAFSKNNAVRKGDVLSYEEMLSLVDTLFACEQPNITPDGKPVFVNISIEELEQKFK